MHRLITPALILLVLVGCATSPTGRNQLKLFSEQRLAEMGAQSFQEMKSQTPVANGSSVNNYVGCVADAITDVTGGTWEVVVFNSDQVNAFALPGGKGGLFCHTPLVAVARQIGRKRALEMAMTGDVVDAATAVDWGLINRAVPEAELDEAVNDLMTRATRGSAASKAMGKRAFYAQVDLDQPKAYAYAMEVMAAGVVTPDGQEGIASFLEKRRPDFRQPG